MQIIKSQKRLPHPDKPLNQKKSRKSLLLLPAKEAAPKPPLLDLNFVRLQGIQGPSVVATLPAGAAGPSTGGYIVGAQSPLRNLPELGAISSKRGN